MKLDSPNRQVLIITEAFPPQNYVSVNRMYRLAKYLPALGWEPHVLTVDRNYSLREDYSLLEALPRAVRIHRARYTEPTGRGVRTAIDGRDRSFAASLEDGQVALGVSSRETATGARRARFAGRALRYVRDRWVGNPDWYNTWYLPALRTARQVIAEYEIPLVITTSPHLTGHRIGARLRKEGIAWVADFRDPAGYMALLHSSRNAVYRRQREIERRAALESDAVTVAAHGIGMILTDMYGLGDSSGSPQWTFIPTGVDTSHRAAGSALAQRPYPYLVYPGWLSSTYGTEFFEIFAEALRDEQVRATGVRVIIVGDLRMNPRLVRPVVERLGLEAHAEFVDFQPQAVVRELVENALAGLLLTGRAARWWCLHAKAVEYMGLLKPVVAVLPDISESRLHLERTGLGVFLDGERREAARTLSAFILGQLELPPVNAEACEQFTAPRQAQAFAEVFEDVLARPEGRT